MKIPFLRKGTHSNSTITAAACAAANATTEEKDPSNSCQFGVTSLLFYIQYKIKIGVNGINIVIPINPFSKTPVSRR